MSFVSCMNTISCLRCILHLLPGPVLHFGRSGKFLRSECFLLRLASDFLQDGLLQQGYLNFINKLHSNMPKLTADGKPLQMIVCSATLHNFDVKKLGVRVSFTA